jgi:methyl coenzyme M reductase alpha subunit
MSDELTLEQQATNAATWRHINTVMRILTRMRHFLDERMFAHDRSKLVAPEVQTFTEYTPKLKNATYGSEEYKGYLAEMKPALDNHYANNRHHPEHFENGVDDMNLIDLMEMFCDWKAACLRHSDGNLEKSIEYNAKRFNLDPQIVKILLNSIPLVDDMKE